MPDANVSLRLAGYPIEIVELNENMVKKVRIIPEFYKSPTTINEP